MLRCCPECAWGYRLVEWSRAAREAAHPPRRKPMAMGVVGQPGPGPEPAGTARIAPLRQAQLERPTVQGDATEHDSPYTPPDRCGLYSQPARILLDIPEPNTKFNPGSLQTST